VLQRGSSITLLVFAAVISLSRVDASAGRAFPIESENYVTESFQRINSRLVRETIVILFYQSTI